MAFLWRSEHEFSILEFWLHLLQRHQKLHEICSISANREWCFNLDRVEWVDFCFISWVAVKQVRRYQIEHKRCLWLCGLLAYGAGVESVANTASLFGAHCSWSFLFGQWLYSQRGAKGEARCGGIATLLVSFRGGTTLSAVNIRCAVWFFAALLLALINALLVSSILRRFLFVPFGCELTLPCLVNVDNVRAWIVLDDQLLLLWSTSVTTKLRWHSQWRHRSNNLVPFRLGRAVAVGSQLRRDNCDCSFHYNLL